MNDATRQYIRQHADDDVRQLALHPSATPDIDIGFALQQIAGRQRAKTKLPTWAATEGLVFPPQLSMEQCSSEVTARYKGELARRLLSSTPSADTSSTQTTTFADLTGGFGVDFSWMAPAFHRACYVERDAQLCAITAGNLQLLGLRHVETFCGDGIDFLHSHGRFDMVFLDPARRNADRQRTYGLSDCQPDITASRDLLRHRATYVMVKLSPMLDWQKAVTDLGADWVREIHIVAVANECKELLMVMGEGQGRQMVCANYEHGEWSVFSYSPQTAIDCPLATTSASPHKGCYVYEPNASVMKSGCFSALSARFRLCQIAPNSHLFVSDSLTATFPGRAFVVEAVSSLNKRELKACLQDTEQANITVRNFPMTVAELRKRLKLGEGGSTYIFATTLASGNRVLLICRKTSLPTD